MTSAVEHQRAATDVKHSKQYPACYQCQQRHVKCSNTLNQTGFPCEACIERRVPAHECMSHFDDPHWVPGVSGATHKRGRAKASRQKKQRNVKAARKEDEDTLSEEDDEEFKGSAAVSSADAGPRRSTRSKLQDGGYREVSGDEQSYADDADHGVSDDEQPHGEDSNHVHYEDGQEALLTDDHAAENLALQAQPDQSAEVEADSETDRLIAIEEQLGAAAERPAVQMILRVIRERLDKGEQNVISSMRYLLARAAGQPLTF
ncbi:hypothetical protein CBER1_08895 [Cercospora berteroae]|uniref:Zn(2)-C6 fungal-type domain-containing protein n=1 Tax=Cercospora berteroae TaxID=357750 RepID=A0A2S6BW73_9PEZI|nr:hypothetical protein CBER1_08895 [Cercospora berteroae]